MRIDEKAYHISMGNILLKISKKMIALSLALILLFNISSNAFAALTLPQNESFVLPPNYFKHSKPFASEMSDSYVKNVVMEADGSAFITITDISEIIGNHIKSNKGLRKRRKKELK